MLLCQELVQQLQRPMFLFPFGFSALSVIKVEVLWGEYATFMNTHTLASLKVKERYVEFGGYLARLKAVNILLPHVV